MSITRTDLNNVVNDIEYLMQTGDSGLIEAVGILKVIELRKINSNLEYIASTLEHAPWNFEE
ncbi:hypothetical protein [Xenorhabdus kozodoii]|uniref:Uncharacterized protein n=1 Tax=Xenorhabdus kozodoii TaxID=351676 RepID=A0A2D0KX07_9GAMM|nr:hypothetical protein [Xenorhabdus kozodoii]PHM67964.1 hypothetical protein Xkoz_03781 [Xenorhabdus kozodoii]